MRNEKMRNEKLRNKTGKSVIREIRGIRVFIIRNENSDPS